MKFTTEESKRILVSWPHDINIWYYAEVTRFDPDTFKHHLVYQDGDEEDLILYEERFIQNHYLAEPGIVSILDIGGVAPKSSPEQFSAPPVNSRVGKKRMAGDPPAPRGRPFGSTNKRKKMLEEERLRQERQEQSLLQGYSKWTYGQFEVLYKDEDSEDDHDLETITRQKKSIQLPHHMAIKEDEDSDSQDLPLEQSSIINENVGPFYIDKVSTHHYAEIQGFEEMNLTRKINKIKNANSHLSLPPAARILEDTRRAESIFYSRFNQIGVENSTFVKCKCDICRKLKMPFMVKKGEDYNAFQLYHIRYFNSLNKIFKFHEKDGQFHNYAFILLEKPEQHH